MDISNFGNSAVAVLGAAQAAANRLGHRSTGSCHILLGFLEAEEAATAAALLLRHGVETNKAQSLIVGILGDKVDRLKGDPPFSRRAEQIVQAAVAAKRSDEYVGVWHLLFALLSSDGGISDSALIKMGVNRQKARDDVAIRLALGGL